MTLVERPHILSAECWCHPSVEYVPSGPPLPPNVVPGASLFERVEATIEQAGGESEGEQVGADLLLRCLAANGLHLSLASIPEDWLTHRARGRADAERRQIALDAEAEKDALDARTHDRKETLTECPICPHYIEYHNLDGTCGCGAHG